MRIDCPICGRVLDDAPERFPTRPFCSVRCKQVDLANWFGERYALSRPLTAEELLELPDGGTP
jgi:hypothetical protein